MRSILVAVIVIFAGVSSAVADETLPSEKMALDVIQWVRHGSEKFRGKYADQALFAKKKNFVLYGKVFEQMAKANKLPKGYSLVADKDLKDIDWKVTGLISILGRAPNGGYEVHASLGPLGMCAYIITPDGNGYRVRSAGGS